MYTILNLWGFCNRDSKSMRLSTRLKWQLVSLGGDPRLLAKSCGSNGLKSLTYHARHVRRCAKSRQIGNGVSAIGGSFSLGKSREKG